jgi:hypothetical protein
MRFTYLVEVEVERDEGLFAGRDEIGDEITAALEGADPGTISGVGANSTSSYSVVSFDVSEYEEPKPPKRGKAGPITEGHQEARARSTAPKDGTAKCATCGDVKPLTKFPTTRGGTDRGSVCRSCVAK